MMGASFNQFKNHIWGPFLRDMVNISLREQFIHKYTGHFLRIRQWGGHLQKGTILYQVWRNDRWLLVTKSLV
jgi:hypothetical protein